MASAKKGVDCREMNTDVSSFLENIWRYKPVMIVLLVAGFIIFTFLVVDAYRYKKKQKKRDGKRH